MNAVVLDAGAALALLSTPDPLHLSLRLHAPRLLRSECLAALRAQVWRGALSAGAADLVRTRLLAAQITPFDDAGRLHGRAWDIATSLGWAKTYDAEYVALAQLLALPFLTLDARLARGVGHMVRIVNPGELAELASS